MCVCIRKVDRDRKFVALLFYDFMTSHILLLLFSRLFSIFNFQTGTKWHIMVELVIRDNLCFNIKILTIVYDCLSMHETKLKCHGCRNSETNTFFYLNYELFRIQIHPL